MGQPLNPELLTGWRGEWDGLRVAVRGLGEIGFSVADTLCELGARVLVVTPEASDEHRDLLAVIGADLLIARSSSEVPAAVTAFRPQLGIVPAGIEPGWIAGFEIPVWGDVELAWRLRDKLSADAPIEWMCVTGAGAGMIADLAARMLAVGGVRAAPAGGDGVPAIDAVRDPLGFDVLIVELTQDDLRSAPRLAPIVGACVAVPLEGEEGDGAGLVFAGNRVACVYGLADPATQQLVEEAEVAEGCRAIGVGLGIPGPSDLGLVEEILVDRAFLDERRTSALELATIDDLRIGGLTEPAGVTAALAAAALARAVGVPPAAIRDALRTLPTHP